MDLKTLVQLVAQRWPFTEEKYPGYDALTTESQRLLFQVRHILLHHAKGVGSLSELCQAAEHGQGLPQDSLQTIARKLLNNALRLACVLDMTPEDLVGTTEPPAAPPP